LAEVIALVAIVAVLAAGVWLGTWLVGHRVEDAVAKADTAIEARDRALEKQAVAGDRITVLESEVASVTAALAVERNRVDLLVDALEKESGSGVSFDASGTVILTRPAITSAPVVTPQANKAPAAPKPVQVAWSGSVEEWRPLAEKYFGPLGQHRVEEALLCISIETGGTGNPNADSNPPYVGLFQMDSGWGSDAQRRNPEYVFACAANSVATYGSWKRWPPMVKRGY